MTDLTIPEELLKLRIKEYRGCVADLFVLKGQLPDEEASVAHVLLNRMEARIKELESLMIRKG